MMDLSEDFFFSIFGFSLNMSKELVNEDIERSFVLPIEILTKIFSFVRISDLAVLPSVCQAWYQATQDPRLWSGANVCIFTRQELFSDALLDSLERKRVKHIVFRSQTLAKQIRQVCEHVGQQLLSLTITNCRQLDEVVLETIWKYCSQLKTLNLSKCHGLNIDYDGESQCFPLLEELNANGCGNFQNFVVEKLLPVCPSITKLHLSGSKRIFNLMWPKFSASCSRLKVLDLTRSDINDEQLKELAGLPQLDLTDLTLTACQGITDEGIVHLVTKQPNIEVLKLTCVEITDKAVSAISRHLKGIRWLDFNGCRQITSSGLQFVRVLLSTLQHINLYSCYQITSGGFMNCFGTLDTQVDSYPLNSLIVNGCRGVTDSVVTKISVSLWYLRELNLGSCFSVSDASLHALTGNSKLLEVLRLGWCSRITDKGLLGTTEDNHSNKKVKCGIKELKKLEYLDLSHCQLITDKGLCCINGLTSLASLNIMMCSKVTDETLLCLAELNKPLRCLNVSGCNITDRGLMELSSKLGCLQSLDLSKCDYVTDKGLTHLAQSCRTLTYLNIKFCSQISELKLPQLMLEYLPLLSKTSY